MKNRFAFLRGMRAFLVLSITQGLSALGSGMTGYALIIWSYQQKGSALTTASRRQRIGATHSVRTSEEASPKAVMSSRTS